MIRNYLKVALRNLRKNKVFSTINILGLSLGLACSLLIMLWVQHERNIDNFHKNAAQLFRIYERQYHDNTIDAGFYTPGLLPETLKKTVPEVEFSSGNAWQNNTTFQVGDKILKEKGTHASEDYFKMFSFPLIEGNAQTALNSLENIAISRKFANDFFGSPEKAMGQTIRMDNRKDLKVTGVFEDMGDNTMEKTDYLASWQLFLEDNQWAKGWGNNGPQTLVMLRKDADPKKVEAKLTKFLEAYNKEMNKNFYIELGMQRFDQTYLHSNFKNGKIAGGRIEYVRLFSIVAMFILLIACINFMNLTTARSMKRAKEIGVRKVVGAIRPILIRQFIGEALLTSFLAILVAILAVVLLLPGFNELTSKQMELPISSLKFWGALVLITILTGLLSGSYPALFLSSFQPIKVLKGGMKFSSKATWFRKGLVVFQFTLSIILIISTIIVSNQINYMQKFNLGYDRENLVYIPLEGDLSKNFELMKLEALKVPGVKLVSRMTQSPTDISNGTGGVEWDGKDPNSAPQFVQASVGYDYVKTMNLKVLQGRDFSREIVTDSVGYLINEAALNIMKFKDPVGHPIKFWDHNGKVIGVLKDFHFQSLHEPILPLILRMDKDVWGVALVRIEGGQTKQALAGLEKICKQLNPKFPFNYQFSDEEYQKLYTSEMVVGKLSRYFAGLAIFICCLGLLGLAMFTAEQRIKEIGIRKVLGASVSSLFTLVSKDFLVLVFIAFLIAAPLGYWFMTNWLRDFAYRTPVGVWIFVFAGLIAIFITLFTVSFQAIKAAMANPVKNLRSE